MAVSFVNIKTNERKTLTRPHQIGAFINSSDLGPNSNKGQDFGWRLSEETVIKLDEMRMDLGLLEDISKRLGIPVDELTTIHLVQHLSYKDDLAEQAKEMRAAREPEFKSEYEQRIEALRRGNEEVLRVVPVVETATTLPVAEEPVAVEKKPAATKKPEKK